MTPILKENGEIEGVDNFAYSGSIINKQWKTDNDAWQLRQSTDRRRENSFLSTEQHVGNTIFIDIAKRFCFVELKHGEPLSQQYKKSRYSLSSASEEFSGSTEHDTFSNRELLERAK